MLFLGGCHPAPPLNPTHPPHRSHPTRCRAQRSLARNAIRRGDWAGAAAHWEAALALNPLNPEGWFSLGFAYIKEKEYEKAVKVGKPTVLWLPRVTGAK